MKTIPLTKGQVALVDDADYATVAPFKWRMTGCYAGRQVGTLKKRQCVLMHRFILGLPNRATSGVFVDHIDGDKLNNQRSNLRIATKGQNMMNCPLRRDNTTGFKGVIKRPWNSWVAWIRIDKKSRYLGAFRTPQAAAAAYDQHAVSLFGEFARTNKSLGLL